MIGPELNFTPRGLCIGVPCSGWKQSGSGREECFEELLSCTGIKNVNMRRDR